MKGSKITNLEHLQSIAEQTGDHSEIEGEPIPAIVAHVWEWFMELHHARGQGAISYSEIKAWKELTGTQITSFELKLLKMLDVAYLTNG